MVHYCVIHLLQPILKANTLLETSAKLYIEAASQAGIELQETRSVVTRQASAEHGRQRASQ